MAEPGSADRPYGDVHTSDSYRQDLVNAVAYAVIGAVFLGAAAINFALLGTWRGRTGVVEYFSHFGLSPGMALRVANFLGFVLLFFSALSFLVVAYSGVVRPLQRVTGMLESSAPGDTDGSRTPISIETVDGTRTFAPDAECVECEDRAIGVVATAFERTIPRTVDPVCPMHLHERRNEYENRSQRVEVETFV